MISHNDLARALRNQHIHTSDKQVAAVLAEILPNPQCGFSCDGATVWGDSTSIDKVKYWNHLASTIKSWRSQHDAQQARAMRAEELGIKLLNFALRCSADNPAAIGHAVTSVHDLLDDLGIEPRVGFFHTQDTAIADAREKFYAAAHPRRTD